MFMSEQTTDSIFSIGQGFRTSKLSKKVFELMIH